MAAGIPYDSREGRAIAGAISAMMTGVSYATSAEMAGELGPVPANIAANREAMLRVMRNHRRAAHGEKRATRSLSTPPVPLDLAAVADKRSRRRREARLGRRAVAGRGLRLPQRAGDRDRADRHDRPRDGLRHDRRRTRLRAGEVQEARGRRLFQDHQPLRARSAARRWATAKRRSTTSSPTRSATARWKAPTRSSHGALARAGFRRRADRRHRGRAGSRPSTSASCSTNGRWARSSAPKC